MLVASFRTAVKLCEPQQLNYETVERTYHWVLGVSYFSIDMLLCKHSLYKIRYLLSTKRTDIYSDRQTDKKGVSQADRQVANVISKDCRDLLQLAAEHLGIL